MDKPLPESDLNALAHACDARAGELHARAWRSEAERNALREATAELLSTVARTLSSTSLVAPVPAEGTDVMSTSELRDMIETRVTHAPLQNVGGSHAWVEGFAPGSPVDEARVQGDADTAPGT